MNKMKNIDLTFLIKINSDILNKKKFNDKMVESFYTSFNQISPKNEFVNTGFKNITNIQDILTNDVLQEEHNDTFFEKNNNIVTMIDYIPENEKTDLNCFWCRHSFDTSPISCPINYKNNQLEKNYYSEITKDRYIIKENIDNEKYEYTLKNLKTLNEKNKGINLVKNDFYISDGIFCSYNCCLSFINENKYNSFYANSKSLLLNIYRNIYGKDRKLIPAPSWRLLKDYGGVMTIEQFRKCFNNTKYIEINKITDLDNKEYKIPSFRPFGIFYTCSISNNSY